MIRGIDAVLMDPVEDPDIAVPSVEENGQEEQGDRGVDSPQGAVSIPILGNDGSDFLAHANEQKTRWNNILQQQNSGDSFYESEPSIEEPYDAGRLTDNYMNSALDVLNFCRYLSGLPDDVKISEQMVDIAQHGAVLLAASDYGHEPERPDDMPDDFYRAGYTATTSSNIAWSRLYDDTLPIIIYDAWMADNTEKNLDNVGHRRWFLNPEMQYTGFGQSNDDLLRYFDVYVRDRSRKNPVSYDAIAYPAGPAFPVEFFASSNPWSISLNTQTRGASGYTYKVPDERKVVVTVTGGGKTWVLNNSVPNTGGDRFYVSKTKSGIPNCIIFRPGGVGRYSGAYRVQVEGLETNAGVPAYIDYTVTFYSFRDKLQEQKATVANSYTVTLQNTEGGKVTGGGTFRNGEKATLTAVPDGGYQFGGWFDQSNKLISTEQKFVVQVQSSFTLQARFTKGSDTLVTENVLPSNEVLIEAFAGTGGTVNGGGASQKGKALTIEANPDDGYQLEGWYLRKDGSLLSTKERLIIRTDENVAIEARFVERPLEKIQVRVRVEEGGTISGSGIYEKDDTVNLSASPNDGYVFLGWYEQGELTESSESYSFTAESDRVLLARFDLQEDENENKDLLLEEDSAAVTYNNQTLVRVDSNAVGLEDDEGDEDSDEVFIIPDETKATPKTGSPLWKASPFGILLLLAGGLLYKKRRKTK